MEKRKKHKDQGRKKDTQINNPKARTIFRQREKQILNTSWKKPRGIKKINAGVINGLMRCRLCRQIYEFDEINYTNSSVKDHQCKHCFNKARMETLKNNPDKMLKLMLRNRLRMAFNKSGGPRKKYKSNEYGIDFGAIAEHLGPCPGDRSDYHIDHIFPLVLFDFDNPEQVRISFLPENHQWLPKEENVRKGDSYDKDAFKEYFSKHYRGCWL